MNHNNCANGATSLALEGFSIPVKICDGLFMADRHIAQVLSPLSRMLSFSIPTSSRMSSTVQAKRCQTVAKWSMWRFLPSIGRSRLSRTSPSRRLSP